MFEVGVVFEILRDNKYLPVGYKPASGHRVNVSHVAPGLDTRCSLMERISTGFQRNKKAAKRSRLDRNSLL